MWDLPATPEDHGLITEFVEELSSVAQDLTRIIPVAAVAVEVAAIIQEAAEAVDIIKEAAEAVDIQPNII